MQYRSLQTSPTGKTHRTFPFTRTHTHSNEKFKIMIKKHPVMIKEDCHISALSDSSGNRFNMLPRFTGKCYHFAFHFYQQPSSQILLEFTESWQMFDQPSNSAHISHQSSDADCTLFISIRLYILVFITSALDCLITYHLSHVPVILQLRKTYLFAFVSSQEWPE